LTTNTCKLGFPQDSSIAISGFSARLEAPYLRGRKLRKL
jgi:hypothetical protein